MVLRLSLFPVCYAVSIFSADGIVGIAQNEDREMTAKRYSRVELPVDPNSKKCRYKQTTRSRQS